jgi:hypothetical protein
METEKQNEEEVKEEVSSNEEIKEILKKHPLYKDAYEFWQSPWGKETIERNRQRERDKEQNVKAN